MDLSRLIIILLKYEFVCLACTYTAQELIKDNFERFLDLIKHSQIGNTLQDLEAETEFVEEYINRSKFFKGIKTQDQKYLKMVICRGKKVNYTNVYNNLFHDVFYVHSQSESAKKIILYFELFGLCIC